MSKTRDTRVDGGALLHLAMEAVEQDLDRPEGAPSCLVDVVLPSVRAASAPLMSPVEGGTHQMREAVERLVARLLGPPVSSTHRHRQGAPAGVSAPRPVARKIGVYLIDDHPIVREGFARALADAPDIAVVGQADSATAALKEAPFASPDVILVDLNMPDRDGIELIGALHARIPEVKLLVLSAYDDEFRVAEALRAGAHGYLVKTSKMAEVIEGIRRTAAGWTALSPRIAGAVVRAMRKPSGEGAGALDALTTRERQVLRLLAMGISTREVAARLTISSKTVETHRVRLYTKLGCKSAIELTRLALRTGLVKD